MSKKWIIIIVFVALLIGVGVFYKKDRNQNSNFANIKISNVDKETSVANAVTSNAISEKQVNNSRETKSTIHADSKEQSKKITNDLLAQSEKMPGNIFVKNEKGEVLENATLEILEKNESILFSTTTDKEGKANINYFSNRRYAEYLLIIHHDNYATKIIESFGNYKYSEKYPLTIILKKGVSVRGVARDKEGNALSGINIKIPFEKNVVKTNGNGIFEFSNVEANEVVFSGWGNNYFYKGLGVFHLPQKEDFVLIFSKGCELVVKVVDINKQGIANAELGISLNDGSGVIEKTEYSDSNGFAYLSISREDIGQISISHPKFVETLLSPYEFCPITVVVLEKGKKIKGVITDKKTLKPIKNAEVWHEINNNRFQSVKTNERGEYEISCLSNGENSLGVYCNGYRRINIPKFILDNQEEIIKNFSLDDGFSCKIKLIDGNSKKPIANKFLTYSDYFNERPVQLLTNIDGEINFALPDGSDKNATSYFFQLDGYADVKKELVHTNTLITYEFFPEVVFKLNVTDPLKQPIENLYLSYNYEIRDKINYIYDPISKTYEVKGFPEGPLNFEIRKTGFVSKMVNENLSLGKENSFNIVMKPFEFFTISLKLISTNKNINLSELSGKINLFAEEDVSSYEILSFNNSNQRFAATFEKNNYKYFEVEFPHHLKSSKIPITGLIDGRMEYELTLNSGRGFNGEVFDEEGKPVVGSAISIKSQDSDNGYSNEEVLVGENGKFYLYGLFPGRFWLTIQHSDYFEISKEVELKSEQETNLNIILKKGIQIAGIVYDSNGKIIANAEVDLLHIPEKLAGEDVVSYFLRTSIGNTFGVETNQYGEFLFKNVPEGNCEISVFSYFGRLDMFPLEVKNELFGLRLTLDKKMIISGTFLDENNKPIKDMRVSIENKDLTMHERNFESRTDDNGYFEFSGVLNIKYKLNAFESEQYFLDDETFLNGGDTNVKLILRSKKSIICDVVNQDGVTVETKFVSFYYVDNSQSWEIQFKRVKGEFLNTYTFEKYEDKLVKAIATAPGYSPGVSDVFNPKQYSGQPIIIKLQKNVSLVVHVFDYYSKNSINDARIIFKTNEAPVFTNHLFSSYADSNSNGEATLNGLVLGKGKIEVKAAGHIGFESEVNIADVNPVLDIYLKRGGSIKGILIDKNNKPLASSPVLLRLAKQNNNPDDIEAITDEKGFYEFNNIPPQNYLIGTYTNSIIQYKSTFAGIFVTIEEDQTTNIALNEMIALNRSAKINISLKGKNIGEKEIYLYTSIKSQSSPPNFTNKRK